MTYFGMNCDCLKIADASKQGRVEGGVTGALSLLSFGWRGVGWIHVPVGFTDGHLHDYIL